MFEHKIKSILLVGPSGAGKSTVGKILSQLYGFQGFSLASALRYEVQDCIIDGKLPWEMIEIAPDDLKIQRLIHLLLEAAHTESVSRIVVGDEIIQVKLPYLDVWAKPTSALAREILQLWGTDFRRKLDPRYFTIKLQAAYNHPEAGLRYVDDCRFHDEIGDIKTSDSCVVYVSRDSAEVSRMNHASESLTEFNCCPDYILKNNSDSKELRNNIVEMIHSLNKTS